MKKLRFLSLVIIGAVCSTIFSGCTKKTDGVDYSDKDNWAYYQIAPEKDADLFLVCPTVDMGKNGNMNMSLTDEDTKAKFVGALNMERGLYENSLTLYAPYYSQATFPVYSLPQDEAQKYMDIAYKDVSDAFRYYIDNSDKNRPIVLAGFSQGSEMVLRLLKEYFSDEALQDRLVAAYCIGWRITQEDIDACPWLKPAQSADDTGVIVSFNSEAADVTESMIVPQNVKTFSINPLNWKTDGTIADKSQNLGACFTDYDGKITKEIKAFSGAYIDPTRGTLKVTDVDPEDYSNSLFPDGVYHLYDYQFFFRNIQENVNIRTAAFFKQNSDKAAA